jgi:lysozyme family protein
MRDLPRDEAAAIYKRLYWLRPRFDEVGHPQHEGCGRIVRY